MGLKRSFNTSARLSATARAAFNVYVQSAGMYYVKLHYSAGNGTSTNTGLYVNGTKVKNISCAGTYNWDAWADATETVALNAGFNTVEYKAQTSSGSCINLDYIIVDYAGALNLKIEAENSALSGTAYKATDHSGYSGTGFVAGYYNSTTAQASFTVDVPSAGSNALKLHYSAGNGASSNTGL